MRAALDLAAEAGEAGEVPVGAVVVEDGEIIGWGRNQREGATDPTAHAEIMALRQAAQALLSWRLPTATMYVTLEPCAMCAGAAVMARLGRLVFGAPDPKSGACGSLYNICSDPRLNHEVMLGRGVLAAESAALLSQWFAARRL